MWLTINGQVFRSKVALRDEIRRRIAGLPNGSDMGSADFCFFLSLLQGHPSAAQKAEAQQRAKEKKTS